MTRQQYLFIESLDFDEETINKFLKDILIKDISCGYSHFILLDLNNNIYVCGDNSKGQIGISGTSENEEITKINKFNNNVKLIGAGGLFTIIVTLDNKIYICGNLNFINLNSINSFTNINLFKEEFENNFIVKKLKCGPLFIIVMNEKNELFGCGLNDNYELGFGHSKKITMFTKLNLPKDLKIKDFNCGGRFTTILSEDNYIYIAGCINSKFYRTFTKIEIPFQIEQFATSFYHTFLLQKDKLFKINDLQNNLQINLQQNLSKIKKIYSSSVVSDFYLLTENNEIYFLLNFNSEFGKLEKEWKYLYLNVYSGENFILILNSNFEEKELENEEKQRMKSLLFKQINNLNSYCDIDFTL